MSCLLCKQLQQPTLQLPGQLSESFEINTALLSPIILFMQMCFLKGRIAEPHEMTHKVLECLDYSKSLKSRFGIKSKTASHSKDFRVMDEPSEMSMSGE